MLSRSIRFIFMAAFSFGVGIVPAGAQQKLTGAEIVETFVGKFLNRGSGYDLVWQILPDGTFATIEGGVIVAKDRWSIEENTFCVFSDPNYQRCFEVEQDWALVTLIPLDGSPPETWSIEDPHDPAQPPGNLLKAAEIKTILVGGVLNDDSGSGIAMEIHPDGKLETFKDGILVATEKWYLEDDHFCWIQDKEFCYLVEYLPANNIIRLMNENDSTDWILVRAP